MRIIKFRVWAKNDGGFFIKNDSMMFVQSKGEDGKDYFAPRAISPSTVIVQQFTGLLDKNGKEIYEGDIVKCDSNHDIFILGKDIPLYSRGKIMWWNEGFAVGQENIGATRLSKFASCDCHPCALEVIGNIFENENVI
jgi:uncharacterized phage protein (TIGR01671 family)